MAQPLRGPATIYEEHVAGLLDAAKLRLVVLITERLAGSLGSRGSRLSELDGFGRDAWEGVDADAYLKEQRDGWLKNGIGRIIWTS